MMGRRKPHKSGKKKGKVDEDIDGLIKSVSDNEIQNFRCEIPTDEELDSLNFPNIVVNPPTLKYLSRNLTTGEWATTWSTLLINKEEELGVGFSTLSEEEQNMHRHQMAEDFRKSTRSLNWKKYKYALEKIDALSWEGKWDDEWSEEDAGDAKSEEDSGGEEGKSEGVEAGGSVGGSKEEAISGVEIKSYREKMASASVPMNELETRGEGIEKLSKCLVGGDIIEKLNMDIRGAEEIGGMPHTPAVSHNMFSFPHYEDNDNVKEYTQPFSLLDWFAAHRTTSSRYLPNVSNKDKWSVENWNGDRLKRESLGIIQSVLSSVMDYHEKNGSNGNIKDHKNIILHQYVISFGGSERIQYNVKLPQPIIECDKSSDLLGLAEDMRQVKLIFEKVLEGRKISEEMDLLFSRLMDIYPFSSNHLWKNKLLRNWPGMWDGKARANFIVDFYYNWTSDSQKNMNLTGALRSVNYLIPLPDFEQVNWIKKIPNPSSFYQILTFSRKNSETGISKVTEAQLSPDVKSPANPPDPLAPQYVERKVEDILRYSRDLLLALGTKLEHIISELAHEVAEKHIAIEGELAVHPSDDHFWFHRPKIVLFLIHVILFQNAFEIAFIFWIWVQYDAVVGDVTITDNRSQYVEFTIPYTDIGVGTIARVKTNEDMWIFTKPIDVDLCLLTAVFSILTGIIIWAIEKPINEEFQGSPSEQIGTIFFSTLIFSSIQQIGLASKGANVGYHSGIVEEKYIVSNLNFKDYTFSPYSTAKENADALSKGSKNGGVYGIIDEIPYVKAFLSRYSPDYAMVDSASTTSGFGFVPELSRAIVKLREEGTLDTLEKKWYKKTSSLVNQDTPPKPEVLKVDRFGGLFLIGGVSLGFALLVRIFHIIRSKLNIYNYVCETLASGNLAIMLRHMISSSELSEMPV
uniref:Ionotropic glutamate receptor C-terminal domain-containing protein n=1 Tax=Daucus carota subsp. sativus TaxID=79200 RepID=A0A161WZ08_DAUCS